MNGYMETCVNLKFGKKATMNNIKNNELQILLEVSLEENGGDFKKSAHDIKTIDLMLGVIKMKSLINRRSRSKQTRWSRGRDFNGVMEAIILRKGGE